MVSKILFKFNRNTKKFGFFLYFELLLLLGQLIINFANTKN